MTDQVEEIRCLYAMTHAIRRSFSSPDQRRMRDRLRKIMPWLGNARIIISMMEWPELRRLKRSVTRWKPHVLVIDGGFLGVQEMAARHDWKCMILQMSLKLFSGTYWNRYTGFKGIRFSLDYVFPIWHPIEAHGYRNPFSLAF